MTAFLPVTTQLQAAYHPLRSLLLAVRRYYFGPAAQRNGFFSAPKLVE
jgi:hypothetical protein